MTNDDGALLPSAAERGASAITTGSTGRHRYSRHMLCGLCCGLFAAAAYNSAHKSVGAVQIFVTKDARARVPASADPDPALPTIALTEPFFKGGFRNQAMRFNQFIFEAREKYISQMLLEI